MQVGFLQLESYLANFPLVAMRWTQMLPFCPTLSLSLILLSLFLPRSLFPTFLSLSLYLPVSLSLSHPISPPISLCLSMIGMKVLSFYCRCILLINLYYNDQLQIELKQKNVLFSMTQSHRTAKY